MYQLTIFLASSIIVTRLPRTVITFGAGGELSISDAAVNSAATLEPLPIFPRGIMLDGGDHAWNAAVTFTLLAFNLLEEEDEEVEEVGPTR